MISPARQVAYQVLVSVDRDNAYVNLALQDAFRKFPLQSRDKSLCTEIVYGTIQRRRTLDAVLKSQINRPLRDLDVAVLTILRMTTYQMGYLTKVPAYAALNEAVELCKVAAPRGAGFVNGVLRALTRRQEGVQGALQSSIRSAEGNQAERLGIQYSYPTWLVQALLRQMGEAETLSVLETCNHPAVLSLRVNPLRANSETVVEALVAETDDDVASLSPLAPEGIRLSKGLDVESWEPYLDGWVTVQDEGAMLISHLLQPASHARVLDMCAAPGTKTTHIAELQGDTGTIVACDVHAHKLGLIAQSAARLGLTSIRTHLADARQLPENEAFLGAFDAVLLDAPCSGFGVLRHRPDIRWRRQPADVKSLAELQVDLLRAAVRMVRVGGLVVYSTCTLLQEENQRILHAVVNDESFGVVLDDIRCDLPASAAARMTAGEPWLLLTPDAYGTDGFFMARLRRER